jgi:hypothetical protein
MSPFCTEGDLGETAIFVAKGEIDPPEIPIPLVCVRYSECLQIN